MTAQEAALDEVVARALQDEAFKEHLIAYPAAVLEIEGVAVPEGVTVKVVEDKESVRHLVLSSAADALTAEEIAAAIGAPNPPDPRMRVSPSMQGRPGAG